ncbi:MAG: hypothetical protein Q8J88_18260 [Bacteroidales bacterium]|nr:hypothetical protein [Bacteroidales bacterium]
MTLFTINIPKLDIKRKHIPRIDPGRPAIFLPVFDIILDRYHGFVINKKAMPEIKESDIWKITKIVAPQLNSTKKDRFWKMMLAIPFLPVILILLIVTKLFKKLDWLGFRFNRFIAELYNFLKGNKPEYFIRRERKEAFPEAVLENIPAFMDRCKERNVPIILFGTNPLSADEQIKLDNLIAQKHIYSYQIINRLRELATFIKTENISISRSVLLLADEMERLEAEELGFRTAFFPGDPQNAYFWSEPQFWYGSDPFYVNGITSLDARMYSIIPVTDNAENS